MEACMMEVRVGHTSGILLCLFGLSLYSPFYMLCFVTRVSSISGWLRRILCIHTDYLVLLQQM
jgi:hypothetical protein